jgi:predicted ATP-grasp superfamily ATP-dependent carboligase
MLDPRGLYEFAGDLPAIRQPVLIQALSGFVDAGGVTRIARDHVMSVLGVRPVAVFDVDQLYDYRSRRPAMLFSGDRWDYYDEPRLVLSVLADRRGRELLMLTGPEPSTQWERFVAAICGLVDRFDVRLTVGLDAIPLAVPHTRPIGITGHATRPELIEGYDSWPQRVQVPGSVGNLLEYRLGQRGCDALGFAVHVPHYLAQAEYPAAAECLLESVAKSADLSLPLEDLHTAAELVNADIDRQLAQAEEAMALVQALEHQYDSFRRRREAAAGATTAGPSDPLPTADELAAELERFLAEQPNPDD